MPQNVSVNIPGGISVGGHAYPVQFETATGRFSADVNGVAVYAPNWRELEPAIRIAVRKAAVRIEFDFVAPGGAAGTATGIHASTGKVLVRWRTGSQAGKAGQVDSLSPLDSSTDVEELVRLNKALDTARVELRAFQQANAVKLPEGIPSYASTSLASIVRELISLEARRAAQ